MGLLAGLVSVAFLGLHTAGDTLRASMLSWAHQLPWLGWLAPVMLGIGGTLIAAVLVRRYAPEASGSGIPDLEAVLDYQREFRWQRVLLVKFVGGAIALGCGLPLGREGPLVQSPHETLSPTARLTMVVTMGLTPMPETADCVSFPACSRDTSRATPSTRRRPTPAVPSNSASV
ncbi:hypothetical protein HGA89_04505, partial [bacterium]|nr:hypothetical protein [bacterium]